MGPQARLGGRAVSVMVLLLLLPGLAGCFDADSPPLTGGAPFNVTVVDRDRPADSQAFQTYWMVLVHGLETRDPGYSVACDAPFVFTLDRDARTFEYRPTADGWIHAGRLDALVVWSMRRPNDCSLERGYTDLDLLRSSEAARKVREELAPVQVEVMRNGTLRVQGDVWVPLGHAAQLSYNLTGETSRGQRAVFNGTFLVENLGRWPIDGIKPRD